MEFTYRISEEDYLFASDIKVTPLLAKRTSWLDRSYWMLLYFIFFAAVEIGLFLGGRGTIMGYSDGELPPGRPTFPPAIIPVAIILSAFFSALYSFAGSRVSRALIRRRKRELRLKHYRTDPTFESEVTLTVTAERTVFCCGTLIRTESAWSLYREWVEIGHILLLVTHSGSRKIVNAAGLSHPQREELRGILKAALPKKK